MSIPSHAVDSSSPPESFFPIDEETNKRYHPASNPNNLRMGCEYCYKTKVSRYCDRHVLGRDLTTGKIIYDVTCGTCFHAKQVCYYKQKGRPGRPRTRVAALDRFQELLEAGQDARDADRRDAQSEGETDYCPSDQPLPVALPMPTASVSAASLPQTQRSVRPYTPFSSLAGPGPVHTARIPMYHSHGLPRTATASSDAIAWTPTESRQPARDQTMLSTTAAGQTWAGNASEASHPRDRNDLERRQPRGDGVRTDSSSVSPRPAPQEDTYGRIVQYGEREWAPFKEAPCTGENNTQRAPAAIPAPSIVIRPAPGDYPTQAEIDATWHLVFSEPQGAETWPVCADC